MVPSRNANPHWLVDERSIALHREVANEIQKKPELLDRARSRVEQWMVDGSVARTYAAGWQTILTLPLDRLADRLIDPGEEMKALRQCSPFAGVLDPRVRWRILKEINQLRTAR